MIHIGISGWSYPGWEEKFYHQKLTGIEQLKFYATVFNTVEINYSFYHIPKAETFRKWHDATPESFVFAIKLNKLFTHTEKLVLNQESLDKLKIFLQSANQLKNKFAVLLIQTAKGLKYDLAVLEKFLEQATAIVNNLEYKPRLAFEFRNVDWFNDEVYSVLEQFQSGLVISQSKTYPEIQKVISNLVYIRMHGPEKLFDSSYSHKQLQEWRKFIEPYQKGSGYVYFNNTMQAQAIENALYLQTLI